MNIVSLTKARMAEVGINFPAKPGDTVPEIANVLSIPDLTDEELMDLFHEFVAWNDYATGLLSQAAVEERIANRNVEQHEARYMTAQWTGKSTDRVTVQKAKMADDPAVRDAHQRADHAYAYRKLLDSIVSKLDRDCNLLSRELTRRTSSYDKPTRRSRSAI